MSSDRQSDLLMLLLAHGQLPVQDIAGRLGASLATVRRDLSALEAAGRITRAHGSARIASGAQNELAFAAREHQQIAAKRAIAGAATAYLHPGQSVFLDAGTTVLQLARHIRGLRIPLQVFTNGLVAAQELAHVPDVTVTLIGGRLRPENLSLVGPGAVSMLAGLWFDHLFLGATAIDADGLLSSPNPDEAAVNAQMIASSAQTIILADHTKCGKRMTHRVAGMAKGQVLITDAAPNAALADTLTQVPVDLLVAAPANI